MLHQVMSAAAATDCLAVLGRDDRVLLVDDGVRLLANPRLLEILRDRAPVAALETDVNCRGLSSLATGTGLDLLDDAAWVRAVLEARQVLSWK
jgi:sulfur relay protein TusB/DsrH